MRRLDARGATVLAVVLCGAFLSAGCAPRESGASEETGKTEAGAKAPAADGMFRGTVVETMNGGGYTYVLGARGDERVWFAGPETELAVGQEIVAALGMPMDGFESRALERTFDRIYFVSSFAADAAPSKDPHAGLPEFGGGANPHGNLADPTSVDPASIELPEGGVRIADLWARRAELVGKQVVVRGRVVKYNGGILDRNWIHLQDGTGDPAKGDHDLTVTSDRPAAVGDVVTVRGTVAVDRDFGAGYSYSLLVEKAAVEGPTPGSL